jgi:hypothetical protein
LLSLSLSLSLCEKGIEGGREKKTKKRMAQREEREAAQRYLEKVQANNGRS